MTQQKKSKVLTAKVATVKIGYLEIEGLLTEEGVELIAQQQVAKLFSVIPTSAPIWLKRILGEGFQLYKVRTNRNQDTKQNRPENALDLDQLLTVIKWANKRNYPVAELLVDALVGLSLKQLWCDAFGVKFDAEERQARLKARMAGMIIRRMLTDVIKAWYERNPGATTCPYRWMFPKVTNQIYQALWQKDALEIEAIAGCGRHKLRNYLSPQSLRHLESAEERVMDCIELDNIKPSDAVKIAEIRPRTLELA